MTVAFSCNDHQFESNQSCRKCGSSKPVKDGEMDGMECVICFERIKNCGFLHGTEVHVACCKECGAKLANCPMCRAKVDKVVTIFF